MAKVIWTEPAIEDVRAIVEHVANDSARYAERLGTGLVEAPRQIETFPHSGRIVPEFDDSGIRELIFGSYRLIYVLREEACYITAVIHASRDIIRHLSPGDWQIE